MHVQWYRYECQRKFSDSDLSFHDGIQRLNLGRQVCVWIACTHWAISPASLVDFLIALLSYVPSWVCIWGDIFVILHSRQGDIFVIVHSHYWHYSAKNQSWEGAKKPFSLTSPFLIGNMRCGLKPKICDPKFGWNLRAWPFRVRVLCLKAAEKCSVTWLYFF